MQAVLNLANQFHPVSSKPSFAVKDLVDRVSWAVDRTDVEDVRRALEQAILNHPGFLPQPFLNPKTGGYARREIYSDPAGRFSILAMVWGPGQCTLLHDHSGLWVVEAVYEGRVGVRNYGYLGESGSLHQFVAEEERIDGPGVSDRRVPPHEHHSLRNVGLTPAVTIHVFGGILNTCNVFEPTVGGYTKTRKTMSLD